MQLINAFGPAIQHHIVSAMPQAMGAARHLAPGLAVSLQGDFPPLAGRPTPWRLLGLARAMQPYDLVLTYNWGAMDAVMAHTIYARSMNLPPLIHHEDGFNADEATRLKPGRNFYRRIGLHSATSLIVPSVRLERIALNIWHQPRGKVLRIPNGVETARFGRKVRRDVLPNLIKRPGEFWVGTLAGLRVVKNLTRMVRAFSGLPPEWHLVILGEGPERNAIMDEAVRLNVGDRVHLPGHVGDPARVLGLLDLFALSSDSEQFPISVVEAMATGLAVAAPDVGDVLQIVAKENQPFIVPAGDEAALAGIMAELAGDQALRRQLGEANRRRAHKEYDEDAMIAAYRDAYGAALGRPFG